MSIPITLLTCLQKSELYKPGPHPKSSNVSNPEILMLEVIKSTELIISECNLLPPSYDGSNCCFKIISEIYSSVQKSLSLISELKSGSLAIV